MKTESTVVSWKILENTEVSFRNTDAVVHDKFTDRLLLKIGQFNINTGCSHAGSCISRFCKTGISHLSFDSLFSSWSVEQRTPYFI